MPPSTRAATSNANCDARGEVKRAALVEINGTEVDRRSPPDGADAAYYLSLTVIELKDLLRRKGSKVSGKKVNLIERLVSSETKSAKPPKVVTRATNVYRDNSIIDLTLDSPQATPTKSVAEAVENEADAGIADSLGALKLNYDVVDAEGHGTDDKENVANGRGREIKEGPMHAAKEEEREDDTAATVPEERRKVNDRIQKQREEEEEKFEREAAAEKEETRRVEAAECGRRKIKEVQEGPWEETVANERGRDFKGGMCAGEEEKRKDDDAAATVADGRRRADERIQKQREEEDEKRKREAAAEEEERRRLEVLEYVRRKQKEDQEAAIQEQAKATNRLIAENRKHEEQANLIERTLRAADTVKFAHYDVLGITHASSAAEVNKGYRKLALKLHPDKLGRNATPKSKEAFNAISNAYEVLKDPSSRSKYDREQGIIRGGDIPPAAVPRDQPSSFWNTIEVGTRITVQDSSYSNGAQGSIQSYDIILDRYYVMLDNTKGQMLFEKSSLFQNCGVALRSATAIELGASYIFARLLRYKTCSNGRCYEVRIVDATTFEARTVDLQLNQFIIPFGTVVRLKYGNRHHGMIVGWAESFDQHSGADGSYYRVRMSYEVVQNVYMMNIEL